MHGDLDAVLLAYPYDHARLNHMIFADDPFLVAMPLDHPLAADERIEQRALGAETLLLLEEGHCLRDHALAACDWQGAEHEAAFQATSLYTLVQMVDNRLGLTVLPKLAIDGGITRGTRLTLRPLAGSVSRQIGLAWRDSSSRGAEFALLGGFFRDELGTPITGVKA